MRESDHRLQQAIELLKEPVSIDPELDSRIMAEIEAIPLRRMQESPARRAWEWMVRGRSIKVSPLGGLAMAAAFAALLFVGRSWFKQDAQLPATVTAAAREAPVAQFVLVAPAATTVSLVGDFNDWSSSATPMQRVEGNGVWSITIPLNPGRYRYAFLINGRTWLGDPSAPPALDDDFGRPGSVVTIGEL